MSPQEREDFESDAAFSRAVALRYLLVMCGLLTVCSVLVSLADSTVLERLIG